MKGTQNKVYKVITDRIVELLEQGTAAWKKPWTNGPAARSYHGREYRGINRMLLSTIASLNGLKGCWITFNQAKKAGGKVKKGAKGIPVVFWKWISEKDENDEPTGKAFPLCRYYTVFSICQTEGIDEPAWVAKLENGTVAGDPIEAAEVVWEGYEDAPALVHAGDQAAYLPDEDRIVMPCKKQFSSAAAYYSTLYHEAVHSTGHHDRLDRFKSCAHVPFGSCNYSREELVAEMGAAFLAGEVGIENDVILDNSAAYLQSWIKVLRGEPRMAVIAGAQAQKAADHILGRKFEDKQENGA